MGGMIHDEPVANNEQLGLALSTIAENLTFGVYAGLVGRHVHGIVYATNDEGTKHGANRAHYTNPKRSMHR